MILLIYQRKVVTEIKKEKDKVKITLYIDKELLQTINLTLPKINNHLLNINKKQLSKSEYINKLLIKQIQTNVNKVIKKEQEQEKEKLKETNVIT